ncbi:hypothetical protein DDE01_07840 [Desulfovibrio desulfuricans]|nr:hypothetical protein DDE01_07840 [Desulfovibrio desulfuricans]
MRITIAVDDDRRIVSGSTVVEEARLGEYCFTARTVDYGEITLKLEA